MDLPTTPSVTAALSLGERHHQLEAGPLQPGPTFHAQAPVSTSFASPAANTSWAEASTSAVLKRPRDEDDFAAAAASSFPDACSSTSSNVSGDASKRVRFEHCAPLPTHDAREERLSRLRLKGRQLRLRHGPVATLKAPEVVLPAFSHDELVALHRSGDHHLRAGSTSGTTSTALPVIVPQTTPPITLRTLSELSFESMLSDVHLRHDIVFEPTLRFRPNVDGARGSQKLLLANIFWASVVKELSSGCRCLAYVATRRPTASWAPPTLRQLPCVCERPLAGLAGVAGSRVRSRLVSRVETILSEVKEIVSSLTPTAEEDPTVPRNVCRERVVELATDVSVIPELCAILKQHCAPMRDAQIDTMLATFTSAATLPAPKAHSTTAAGLRQLLAICEAMKLDIANHQLTSLRPYLLASAVRFGKRRVADQTAMLGADAWAQTADWLRASSGSVRTGFLDLVFGDMDSSASRQPLPESWQLDQWRLSDVRMGLARVVEAYAAIALSRCSAADTTGAPDLLGAEGSDEVVSAFHDWLRKDTDDAKAALDGVWTREIVPRQGRVWTACVRRVRLAFEKLVDGANVATPASKHGYWWWDLEEETRLAAAQDTTATFGISKDMMAIDMRRRHQDAAPAVDVDAPQPTLVELRSLADQAAKMLAFNEAVHEDLYHALEG